MYKVTLTLDEQGNLIDVEPRDSAGNILHPVRRNLGVNWTSGDLIDNVNTFTILSKPGHSPCCLINGGTVWCWC